MSRGRDWSAEVGTLVGQVKLHYLVPDVAEKLALLLQQHMATGRYRAAVDERALANMVTEDMQSVNGDKHLFLEHCDQEVPDGVDPVDDAALQAQHAQLTGHGFAKIQRLPGNVAMLDIRRFYEPSVAGAGDAAVAAMNLVAGADALIVDLRRNTGGEPAMVALLSSFLFDARTQLSSLHFPVEGRTQQWWTSPLVNGSRFGGTKPVWVLTSDRTISGGEAMAYDLQQSGRATVVGEITAGSANFHYPHRVSAHLLSGIPSGYPVNPVSGTNWERVGVRPDTAVPADQASRIGYRLALEHVLRLGSDGARREVSRQAARALAARNKRSPDQETGPQAYQDL